MNKARATNHVGKQGQGTSRHNFREFPKQTKEKGASDINRNLTNNNQYYVGGRFFNSDTEMKNFFNSQTDFFIKQAFRYRHNKDYKNLSASQKYELGVYQELLDEGIKAQHRRNAANRQECLDRDALDILTSTKTSPEESILQVGSKDYCPINAEQLWSIYKDYVKIHNNKFGQHIVILDAVLHTDETTLHIHSRVVYVGANKHGEPCISKNSALELLGISRPDLRKPQSRYNNPKQTYTAMCRNMWLECCRQHGLDLETESHIYEDKHGLELTEFKVRQEKEKLEALTAEQKKVVDKNTRLISKQEQMIAEYKNNWKDVDMAMYIAGVLQRDFPEYCKEIEDNYWQDVETEEQQTTNDLELETV